MKKAIIVGAGLGGLTTGALLARDGWNVTVYDKNAKVGGVCALAEKNGYKWEQGPLILGDMLPGESIYELLASFGIHLPTVRADRGIEMPDYTVWHPDEYAGPYWRREYLKTLFPEDSDGLDEYYRLYDNMMEIRYLSEKLAKNDNYIRKFRILAKFFKVRKYMKMTAQEVFDYLEMPMDIQAVFNNLWWYLGPKIDEFPFFRYAPVVLMLVTMPTYFPNHACHGYLAEMETKIRENGGDVWLNTEVTEIVTKDGKVCGVKTNHGDYIETTQVIADVSPRIVFEDLIKEDSPKRSALLEKQKDITENFSFTIVYLGLNKSAEELGIKAHHLFIADAADARETYEASRGWEGPYCIGALCPNVTVKDFSPEGTCVLSLSVPMLGSALEGMTQEEYFKMKDEFAAKIIKTTGDHLGIDLFECIEEISIATPATLSRYAGVRNGALGYARTFADIKKNEAATAQLNGGNPEEVYEGLSFVGQFAYGIGYQTNVTGIPVAMQVAQKIKGGN